MKKTEPYRKRSQGRGVKRLVLLGLLVVPFAAPAEMPYPLSLKGYWKFRIGDREQWALCETDDSDWARIKVPGRWEDAGYQGYDGFAWYRTRVVIPAGMKSPNLVLQLGYVDDTDEVFFNGRRIGRSGTFPPNYVSAYNALRKYPIPQELICFGTENLIAVRVYDSHLEGGIVSGDPKIYVDTSIPPFAVNLSGEWSFNPGQSPEPQNAVSLYVPGAWENQGFYGYDGYAVYFRRVYITENLAKQRLVLVAGRIDDVDRLVINGKIVGQTGDFSAYRPQTMYRELRNYVLPPGTCKAGEENLIEIRVRDTGGEGGILEGPVGIISQDDFRQYWKATGK
ncbi:MAG: beta galactosidase jelly roll domain-containing protein [Mangrovibacterium sp.]